MSGPTMKIKHDVVPAHLLAVLRAKIKEGQWVVRVGLPDGERAVDAEGKAGPTLAELGAIHEYGTANIPPRPFLATGLGLAKDRLREVSRAMLVQITQGRRSIEEGLAMVGQVAKGVIQKTIAEGGHFEENAPSTIAQKGSSKPLIDTGQLRQSIDYQVTGREGSHVA